VTEIAWMALVAGILLGVALTILGSRMHRNLVYRQALFGDISLLCSDDISLAYLVVQADSGAAFTPATRDLEDRVARLEVIVAARAEAQPPFGQRHPDVENWWIQGATITAPRQPEADHDQKG